MEKVPPASHLFDVFYLIRKQTCNMLKTSEYYSANFFMQYFKCLNNQNCGNYNTNV
ncbi:MAG: hypothetical protein LBP54_02025 [Campylobacteraceae bacterium]|nr:hypothetical protein [Campylobacteraceae bacterium]